MPVKEADIEALMVANPTKVPGQGGFSVSVNENWFPDTDPETEPVADPPPTLKVPVMADPFCERLMVTEVDGTKEDEYVPDQLPPIKVTCASGIGLPPESSESFLHPANNRMEHKSHRFSILPPKTSKDKSNERILSIKLFVTGDYVFIS